MALYLVRCSRALMSVGQQRNVQNLFFSSIAKKCTVCTHITSNTTAQRILTNDLHSSPLKTDCSGKRRTFHSSCALLKKFKESDYETLCIVDPNGRFLCNAEMLVLEKFCHNFRRYSFQELKGDDKDNLKNAVGDGKLRVFQIVDKRKDNPGESKDSKTKLISFHKAAAAEKMSKVIEILVDKGKVNLQFHKETSPAVKDVRKMLEKFKSVKIISSPDKTLLFVKISDIEFDLLQELLEDVRKQEADHIAKVQEMLKTVK